ncbi:MAG: helix-turn-helix domain-containing protein [Albidovulum sp.]|jgi:Ner family transcriptional regulator
MRKQPKMDWPGIVAELHRQGMTLTELAVRNGLHAAACRKVGTVKHYPAQEVIAKFLGCSPEDLWPDRYPRGGPRILDRTKYPLVASPKSPAAADKKDAA